MMQKDFVDKKVYEPPMVQHITLSANSILMRLSIGEYFDDFEPGGEFPEYVHYRDWEG